MSAPSPVLYQAPGIVFTLDLEIPCIVNEWSGYIPSEAFRRGIEQLVECLRRCREEHGFTTLNLLADTRRLGVLPRQDVDWVNQEINPRYLENGASHEAFVLPRDAFGATAVKRYVMSNDQHGPFTVGLFEDIATARDWLRQVP